MKIKLLIVIVFLGLSSVIYAQDYWIQKADFAGSSRQFCFALSIGPKGYCGLGNSINYITYYNDFWEWDPGTNVWTQIASFPGAARGNLAGFSIGTKGYVGTGAYATSITNYICFYDFYEYDPSANTWTAKSNFPGAARYDAVGFAIGNKGYIGLGYDAFINYNDFYEYDPITDTWTKIADFPGGERRNAVGFSIGTKGYVGTGFPSSNDFWEYDPSLNTWTEKASFGGTSRYGAVGFSIYGKGYIGTGYDGEYKSDFWEWDPNTNAWTDRANFGGVARVFASGFSIGSKGYIGTGQIDGSFSYTDDFWEYSPIYVDINEESNAVNISVFPNPFSSQTVLQTDHPLHNATLTVQNCYGQTVAQLKNISGQKIVFSRNKLPSGLYFIQLTEKNKLITVEKFVITDK
jgi:N-acetylneuraminic acid mutarotase